MLQDLTEKDLIHIPNNMKSSNLLIVYNFYKKYCHKTVLENFIFDDIFDAGAYDIKMLNKLKVDMKTWKDYSYFTYYKPKMFDYLHPITEEHILLLKTEYPEFKNVSKGRIENYVRVILNKLRPSEEFYKNVLEEEWRKEHEKEQQQLKKEKEKTIPKQNNNNNNNKLLNNAFIYGIYIDNKLAYIGKTYRDLKTRLGEHIECTLFKELNSNSQQNYLYKAMRECEVGYKFKILYESHNTINNYELEKIEKTLIENIQPEFNYEGVKVPYRFSSEKN